MPLIYHVVTGNGCRQAHHRAVAVDLHGHGITVSPAL